MEILQADYTAELTERGRNSVVTLSLTAQAGQSIFLHGPPSRCRVHFETLCGLRRPARGGVTVCGTELYALPERELAAFRRDKLGIVPDGGGMMPEVRLLDQAALPLLLAGASKEEALEAIRRKTSPHLPMHSLFSPPARTSPRKIIHASLLRAGVNGPALWLLEGALDGFPETDGEILWQALQSLRGEAGTLLYFSAHPAPETIPWTAYKNL